MRQLRGFSSRQLLLIADRVTEEYGVTVRNLPAIAAAAAVTTAELSGIQIHRTSAEAGDSLAECILRLQPLSGSNREFADIARDILQQRNEEP